MDVLAIRTPRFWAVKPDEERDLAARYEDEINALSHVKVTPEDVHVRGMWLCNSQVDSYYSKFSPDMLDEVAELLPGAPVMTGHRRDTLPLGTFFAGQRELRPGTARREVDSHWVKGLFYFPRDAEGDAIARRIDLGNYREVSIGFWCVGADCSICGNFIMGQDCAHVPGELYKQGLCHYDMSGVLKVAEGSIVYRGAQKDTETFTPDGARAARMPVCRSDEMRETKGVVLRADGERAKRSPGQRRAVQSLQFSTSDYDKKAAARWCRNNDFRADRHSEAGLVHRFEQFKSQNGAKLEHRQLGDGVAAVLQLANEDDHDGRSRVRDMTLDELFA